MNVITIRLVGDLPEDTLLRREELALALSSQGFPISACNLALLAHRGTGPDFFKSGARVLYSWGTSLEWARKRLEARKCTRISRVA